MDYMFNVTYTGTGWMIVEADSEKEAKEKAGKFDCLEDEIVEGGFDEVDLGSCEENI